MPTTTLPHLRPKSKRPATAVAPSRRPTVGTAVLRGLGRYALRATAILVCATLLLDGLALLAARSPAPDTLPAPSFTSRH